MGTSVMIKTVVCLCPYSSAIAPIARSAEASCSAERVCSSVSW